MKLKEILKGEIVNNCIDIARIMEKIDRYITKLEIDNEYLVNENQRLEELLERYSIQNER
jgi:hypothetical protein